MGSKFLKFIGLGSLALSLVLAGCESANDTALTGPGEKDEVLLTWRSDDGYTLARETDATVGVVTARIDEKGGVLSIGRHLLQVPAGAVSAPTLFTMHKLPGEIKVGLTATRLLPNDVGHAGFQKPVRLLLSYADAGNVTDAAASRLVIMWEKPGGALEAQPSWVDTGTKVVQANLSHFSDYNLMFPD